MAGRTPPPASPPAAAPGGRPAYVATDKDRLTVKVMIAGGIEQDAIALVLGITAKTLRKHFRREINTAAAEADAAVVASLYQMATKDKNVVAAIWWTKTRMRWSEKLEVEGDLGFGQLVELLEARRVKANGG